MELLYEDTSVDVQSLSDHANIGQPLNSTIVKPAIDTIITNQHTKQMPITFASPNKHDVPSHRTASVTFWQNDYHIFEQPIISTPSTQLSMACGLDQDFQGQNAATERNGGIIAEMVNSNAPHPNLIHLTSAQNVQTIPNVQRGRPHGTKVTGNSTKNDRVGILLNTTLTNIPTNENSTNTLSSGSYSFFTSLNDFNSNIS